MSGTLKSDPKGVQENAKDREKLERKLEEGLKGTFPASDPVAVSQPAAPEPKPKKR
jgi:hypothetical protein